MVTSLVAIGSDNRDDNGDDNRDDRYETMAGVCEMKLSKKGINQLIANMVHFGTQITVKALKRREVVDLCTIYGLAINYKERKANLLAWILLKLLWM